MKNECLLGVNIEFKILMRKVKSPLEIPTKKDHPPPNLQCPIPEFTGELLTSQRNELLNNKLELNTGGFFQTCGRPI